MRSPAFLLISALLTASSPADEWRSLFNGKDLTGWDIILEQKALNADPEGHVTIQNGTVHMYRDTKTDHPRVPFGVIMTKEKFSSYHLSLEYQFLPKKFSPRANALRDAGLLYHCYGSKEIWPKSVEFQIQEGDSGDIVFLGGNGKTWFHPNPAEAPEGQGAAGLLPEQGGQLRFFPGGYVGRLPELDKLTGWNTVEVVVHRSDSATHIINDQTIARIIGIRDNKGRQLSEGHIALQLEAAEIQYRNIKIKPLEGYLQPAAHLVTLSKVKGYPGQPQPIRISNTAKEALTITPQVMGKDAAAFAIAGDSSPLAPGATRDFTVTLNDGDTLGLLSAGVHFGDKATGCFIQLQGVATSALEGKNEPPLQQIMHALGSPMNVGGPQLSLDVNAATIGDSITTKGFSATGKSITITPLARFSPKGQAPLGVFDLAENNKTELGTLEDATPEFPNAHQTLMPPYAGLGMIAASKLPSEFGFYLAGPHFTSYTTPDMATDAKIKHTARVYPISMIQGRDLQNAYLIGFEEASNGDYQDALFLVEGVKALPQ